MTNRVYLSYNDGNREAVEAIALRLRSDGRLSYWFGPWHSVPGRPSQEQMEEALWDAQACAVFLGGRGEAGPVAGWQNEQMRAAIQTRVEDAVAYRIIPVLLPGAARPGRRDLPPFLRRYEMVEFAHDADEEAFNRLLAGILGIAPVDVAGFVADERNKAETPAGPAGRFARGHALIAGIAAYEQATSLPEVVRKDARDIAALLADPAACGYPAERVRILLDGSATRAALLAALAELARQVTSDDTVVVFFSGHGARVGDAAYLLPYDTRVDDLAASAVRSSEFTAALNRIRAARLLVLLDCCHSGDIGAPKAAFAGFQPGWSDDAYAALGQGRGRALIASSRPEELSWVLPDMANSLFTHHLLEALRGEARTLGDGYVRVFDLFRHVADRVPHRAAQHPIFKAADMDADFPIALNPRG